MANIVQLKRSSVANKLPEAANIAVGEPVVNLTDKILYTKNGSNAIIVIGAGTTSNIAEGTNLYFTNTRAVSAFVAGDNITIESNGRISANVIGGGGSVTSVAGRTGDVVLTNADISGLTTANVVELTNLYFTNTRAVAAFTAGDNITIESNGRISASVTGNGGGGASVTIANVAPGGASVGDLYWDEELLTLFIFYDDGDTQQWVESSPASGNNPFEFSKSVGGSETELFKFNANLYRSAKFIITLNDDPNFKVEEILLIHNGSDVSITQPYLTDTQASLGSVLVTYSANIFNGNVSFNATADVGSPVAKGLVTLIRI